MHIVYIVLLVITVQQAYSERING